MNRADSLDPEFRPLVEAVIREATAATGVQWMITSGRRTMAEQKRLYNQGRTTPGLIVTKAQPGQSAHNFGLAADLAPMQGAQVWWKAPDTIWKQMADIAVAHGLTAGFYFRSFKDRPHIEHPAWKVAQAKWKAGELTVA